MVKFAGFRSFMLSSVFLRFIWRFVRVSVEFGLIEVFSIMWVFLF